MGNCIDSSKFESQCLSYKQYTYFFNSLLCKQNSSCYCLLMCGIGINFNPKLPFCLLYHLWRHWISLSCLAWQESFCERNDNFEFCALYYMKTNLRLELSLYNNDFFPLYLTCNLTSSIQILINHSKYT